MGPCKSCRIMENMSNLFYGVDLGPARSSPALEAGQLFLWLSYCTEQPASAFPCIPCAGHTNPLTTNTPTTAATAAAAAMAVATSNATTI